MIAKILSPKLVLVVIGLGAGSGISNPAGYAAFHPVTSSEIAKETIQSLDIKDAEVKAADIATDAVGAREIATNAVGPAEIAANAVGASEIAGASELIFSECTKTHSVGVVPASFLWLTCNVGGARPGDVADVTFNGKNDCFSVRQARI